MVAERIETGQVSPARYTDLAYIVLKSLSCSYSHMVNFDHAQLKIIIKKMGSLFTASLEIFNIQKYHVRQEFSNSLYFRTQGLLPFYGKNGH
jgi:hypothetical protein